MAEVEFLIHQVMKPRWIVVISVLTFSFCRKKIEIREVEVEKKFSWTENKRFSGTEKIFLSSGNDGKTVFLQQPYFFTALTSQDEQFGATVYGAGLPTDVDVRMVVSPTFSAFAASDTILKIISNTRPNASPSGGYVNVKGIDPTLTAIQRNSNVLFKAMSATSNDVLLLSYFNNRPSQPLTFMMVKVKTNSTYPYVDTLWSKVIAVPRTSVSAYVRHFTAVNNYFLADLSANGIYKITENGSFTKVHSEATVDAFYEWEGKVYAHAEWDKLLISADDGSNWQAFNGIPPSMVISAYYKVKDSLVGVFRDNLFTLNWSNTSYTQRALKNDGLEGSRINGLEVSNDTVCVATTKGLFYKPLHSFFDTK